MTLALIEGPPNSGRAGAIRRRLEAALARDPVLVVPTLEDADRFERELCAAAGDGAVLGASILTFERLFEDVLRVTGAPVAAAMSEVQELHVARVAIARTELRVLARSARRPGFARALVPALGELQAGCLDPASVERTAGDDGGFIAEIAALYAAFVEVRDDLGLGSRHTAAASATAALRARPEAWGGRPAFVYGFDDLTREQLELLSALSDAAPVTVTVTYEDRAALAARARLRSELRDLGAVTEERLESNRANTTSATLFHLERSFLAEQPQRRAPDDGLVLMEAAGERGQVEQVAGEVARLLEAGARPDSVAVVLRDPNRDGPLYESVLRAAGIPVATEAKVPLTRTAVGRGLAGLVRAALRDGDAGDLLAFVRAPGVARHSDADWLECRIRRGRLRTAVEALDAWNGRELFEIEELRSARDAAARLGAIARFARRIAERPYEREAPHPVRERRLELRAGAAAAEALEELATLREIGDAAGAALAALDELEVPLWQGPTQGHVRVTSPYRIRARRVDHLFVASLQDGEFPRRGGAEPLLDDEQRAALGLPERADPEDEERYLFYVCLSRPAKSLHLCWRSCDDEGGAASRSPFLDDVRDLLDPPPGLRGEPDPIEERVRRRGLAELSVHPAGAPEADARDQLRQLPGPVEVDSVLAALGERDHVGPSTLEEYALCSYRWFVGHELDPAGIDPDPDARAEGSLLHAVLERLYREPPGGEPAPDPRTLDAWGRRAAELVGEIATDMSLGGSDARSVVSRARVLALVEGHLEREAGSPSRLVADPELLEASFGEREDDIRPALDLGGLRIHGTIDRVDVPRGDGGGAGLVRDYKSSRRVVAAARLERDGKLQLQLYALALERLWKRRALGAVYEPLGATQKRSPRGMLRADERDGLLEGLDAVGPDLLDDGDFQKLLDDAEARAVEIVTAMRAGRIDRDPIEDRCPPYCEFQAVCRRERGGRDPERPFEDEEIGEG